MMSSECFSIAAQLHLGRRRYHQPRCLRPLQVHLGLLPAHENSTRACLLSCSSGIFRNGVNEAKTKQLSIGVASQRDIYGSETADLHLFFQALQSFLCSFILWVYPEMSSGFPFFS